jgi:hypothetical protein
MLRPRRDNPETNDPVSHPWPQVLPRSRWSGRPAEPLVYTRVRPDTVVELVVDPVADGPRWRHLATFVRLRPDLRPTDLVDNEPTPEPSTGRTVPAREPFADLPQAGVSS